MPDLTSQEMEAIARNLGPNLDHSFSSDESRLEGFEAIQPATMAFSNPYVPKIQLTQLQEKIVPTNSFADSLKEIKVLIEVILGRTKLPIKQLLELQNGSVLTLDKLAGEPVEIEANGQLIARGEVVVIHDHYGIQITQLITAEK